MSQSQPGPKPTPPTGAARPGGPVVGITMGDPAGVGAEVITKALSDPEVRAGWVPVVIGDLEWMERTARQLQAPVAFIPADGDDGPAPAPPAGPGGELAPVPVLAGSTQDITGIPVGQVDPRAGQAAYDYVARGVGLALAGKVDALVTAPINKAALAAAGVPFPGHTEILGHLTGVRDYAMLLAGRSLRVAHVTTHIPLRVACDRVKRDRVAVVIRLLHTTLQRMGFPKPRIGVAGLNPHAGEGGLFGHEEAEIEAAVEQVRGEGVDVSGPYPPDTIFYRAYRGGMDGVVAMYHDQGHIPIKLVEFDTAVNITMGLPFWRVSVDHGTAFDIAGRGIASAVNMKEAIAAAVRLARGGSGGNGTKPRP